MLQRKEPFADIYKKCDDGTMSEKLISPRPFPLLIDCELTNLCNFTCRMCPTGRGVMMRPKGCMSLDLLKKITYECAANDCAIRFVRWGEPLCHPDFTKALHIVKVSGLMCHINTNGYFVDYGMASAFLRIGLDSIKFSFQGTDEKGYAKWRGKHYKEVVGNLHILHSLRGKRERPFISVGTTITDETEGQIRDFKQFISLICDKVVVGKTREIVAREEKGCFPECPELFDKMSIDWDGMVTACCADFDRFMLVGDANKQTLKEIFNGERMGYFRKMLVEGRHNELELCRGCCSNTPMGGSKGADIKDTKETTATDKKIL